MIKVSVDGVIMEMNEEKCVLENVLLSGKYIPHLCHHPDLPENGSCRMCVVEVDGEVQTSCTLYPREGMKVTTKSEQLQDLRMMALELLLAAHPEDCSTCPKYGNCELQTLIQYMGGTAEGLRRRVKGFKVEERNPLLIHDMNRCVLCGRCVRACKNLRDVGILDYKKKDMESYIGTLHGKLLSDENCKFCQACAEVCPTGTIRDKLLSEGSVEGTREDTIVPCRAACPAHTDVPRYIRYVNNGDYDAAGAVIREKVPFPKVLGYICNHVCELSCKRTHINEALSIREIKRYAAEHDSGRYWKTEGKQLDDTGKKVCVVGGGPAGLTAAYYLRKQGHDVTLKEAFPKVGGMMRYGIPEYRLPRNIIEEEYDFMEKTGISTQVGEKVEDFKALKQEYDAVLIATGAHKGVCLPLEGNELPGVMINTEFLHKVSMEESTNLGERVVVLGGGNVAFDCARSAKRLGAKEVHLACLETRDKMPAAEDEIQEALEEGIKIYPAKTFERITGSDYVTGVEFQTVKAFRFDENGRAIIDKEQGSEFSIAADTVIFATGQRPDLTEETGLEMVRGCYIKTKEGSLSTSEDGIFAAGDVVYGTKSVIQAIASGRDAAVEIDRFLGGDGDISETFIKTQRAEDKIGIEDRFLEKERKNPVLAAAKEREDNFNLFNYGICSSNICDESSRCLQCDLRLNITPPRIWGDFENKEEKV